MSLDGTSGQLVSARMLRLDGMEVGEPAHEGEGPWLTKPVSPKMNGHCFCGVP